MLACVLIDASLTSAQLLDTLDSFSPTLEILNTHAILLDLGKLSDDKQALEIAKRLVKALAKCAGSKVVRVGLAEGRFLAGVAAHNARPGSHLLIPAGNEAEFLRTQPVSCLPVDAETLRRLQLLGIHTIGDVTRLPEGEWTHLFGEHGRVMADLARGEDSTLLASERRDEPLTQRMLFDFPIEGGCQLISEVEHALQALCTQLTSRKQLATRVVVRLFFSQHDPAALTLHLASPADILTRILPPLKDRLSAFALPEAISGIELSLEGCVTAHNRQLTFASLLPRAARWRNIQRVAERLSVRDSSTHLMQVVWDDPISRIPERRAHLQDLMQTSLQRGLLIPHPAQVMADSSGVPRLVRMRSGWRSVGHVVEAWELDDEWWTSLPITRAYYRVQLDDGGVVCLFRDLSGGRWYRQNR